MSGTDRYPSTNKQDSWRKQYGTRYRSLERQVQPIEKEGVAVLIPGVGSVKRAAQVEINLQWLKNQSVPFECWMYVWKSEEELPLDASRFAPCQLIRHPGFWMNHILELPLNMTRKPWVIHMMDSSEPQPDVNLSRMLNTMVANGLGAASPTFSNKSVYPASTYPMMIRQENIKTGRFVDFIEMHFVAFSRQYFACFQDHIDPENPLGWGFDRLLPAFCGGAMAGSEIKAGRMGLMDQMTMVKKESGSYNYDKAYKGMIDFISKHEKTRGPHFLATGELKAPEDVKPNATLPADKLPMDVKANAPMVPWWYHQGNATWPVDNHTVLTDVKANATLPVDGHPAAPTALAEKVAPAALPAPTAPVLGGSPPLDGEPNVTLPVDSQTVLETLAVDSQLAEHSAPILPATPIALAVPNAMTAPVLESSAYIEVKPSAVKV